MCQLFTSPTLVALARSNYRNEIMGIYSFIGTICSHLMSPEWGPR